MQIDLSRIPEEGERYTYNHITGELNETLKDLIGSNTYDVDLFIKPLPQNTFQISGHIRTQLPEDCGKCGDPFSWSMSETVRTLLVPSIAHQRGDKYAKPNHLSDHEELDAPDAYNYRWPNLEMGEFVHEIIALAEPAYPHPPIKADGKCSLCDKNIGIEVINFEDPGFEKPKSPLTELKKIKLNS